MGLPNLDCKGADRPITKEEFVNRFVVQMIKYGGKKFSDGSSVEEYAKETALTYWDEQYQRDCGPEECADADISYWGE